MRSNWSSDVVNKPENRAFEVCPSQPLYYFVNYQLPEKIRANLCRTHNVERIFFDGGTYLVSTNRGNQKANTPPMDHTQRWQRKISNRNFPLSRRPKLRLWMTKIRLITAHKRVGHDMPDCTTDTSSVVLACGELVINRCLLSSSLFVILCCVHTRSLTTWSMW